MNGPHLEVGIERDGVQRRRHRRDEAVGQRQRRQRRVDGVERMRERRLLRHLLRQRLIDVVLR